MLTLGKGKIRPFSNFTSSYYSVLCLYIYIRSLWPSSRIQIWKLSGNMTCYRFLHVLCTRPRWEWSTWLPWLPLTHPMIYILRSFQIKRLHPVLHRYTPPLGIGLVRLHVSCRIVRVAPKESLVTNVMVDQVAQIKWSVIYIVLHTTRPSPYKKRLESGTVKYV
jgi:hypothetical protein